MRTGLGRKPEPREGESPIWKAWRLDDLAIRVKDYRSQLETMRRELKKQNPVDRNLAQAERELELKIQTLERSLDG